MDFVVFVILIIIIVLAGALLLKRRFTYWERMGIPYITPEIPYGNIRLIGKMDQSDQLLARCYNNLKGKSPYAGLYYFTNPVVLLFDVNLIEHVLVKDFQFFSNRSIYHNEHDDPLSVNLYSLDGEKWRQLRNKLTSVFVTSNINAIFQNMIEITKDLELCLANLIKEESTLEIDDVVTRFTIDEISMSAFGFKSNTLINPENDLKSMIEKSVKCKHSNFKKYFIETFPNLAPHFGITKTDKEVSEYFLKFICEIIYNRESNNIRQNDFIDLMINLKDKSFDSLTLNEIAAQTYLFIIAGYEPIVSITCFALYELSINTDVQEKLRHHIRINVAKHDGKLTYDAISDMNYLEQVVNETIRKYPPIGSIYRTLTKNYQFPGQTKFFTKETKFCLSIYGIHHDPDYYPEPEKFDPERFTIENINKRKKFTFLPFGDGPRNCIGLHYALLHVKIAIVTFLLNYDISTCSKKIQSMTFSKIAEVLSPENRIWLNMKKILPKASKIPRIMPAKSIKFEIPMNH